MYLVSTGKKTVLSNFFDLCTESVYEHTNGETSDFQFYEQKRIFVEVNKKSGLDIMRVKEKPNQKMELQRVRKLNIENVYCVGCAKKSLEEMALGLSNGQVKLYNYKNSEFVYRFNADNIRNSVLYLDYNASDEYVSSVFENGQINIYGIKTKTKIDTLNIDGSSTLARFHPTKRLQLSIASYKGGVTIYDIQSKRKIFHSSVAHMSPCRDLCMCAAAPDTLISVGFDCVINIFDTRRKTQPLRLTYCHPLSTVAMSDCGTYFCVGNLKGELTTFDLRNPEVCLSTKLVHDSPVTRIAFVPHEKESGSASFSSTGNQSLGTTTEDRLQQNVGRDAGGWRKSLKATTTRAHRDSFCDFLDFQANKSHEKMSSRLTTCRDSFDWEALARKPNSDENRGMGSGFSSVGSANNSGVASASDSFDIKLNSPDLLKTRLSSTAPLRERNTAPRLSQCLNEKLVKITEEQPQLSQQQLNISSSSEKENPPIDLELSNRLNISHVDGKSSTPNRASKDSLPLPVSKCGSVNQSTAGAGTVAATSNSEISKEMAALRAEMNTRFEQLESELKFTAEKNKWQIFTQAFNLWSKTNAHTEETRDALSILLQTDPFVNEFLRLKEENEMLKSQLQQIQQKK